MAKIIMTAADLVAKAKQIEKTNTVYMWGTYGQGHSRPDQLQRGVIANPLG